MSWATPQSGQTTSTRRVAPLHKLWQPDPYMERGVQHLMDRMSGGLALDPGMRKTSITLAAFLLLKRQGMARTMLVVAPLRVCRMVWRQEGAKWTQFKDLTFTLLHGPKKDERLKEQTDIHLINPEGCVWLAKKFWGRSLPYDVVTIDELTKFKNHQSERSKALRPRMNKVKRRWGLTGSLLPNGFMDLFGQMLMLDDGAALGKYITHYRDQYFQVGYDGFTYDLMPGAETRIVSKIAPYWLQLSADDYLTLPPLVADPIYIELDPSSRKHYEKMKRDMIAELPQGVVTASNAASTYAKLSQMANGAVYFGEAHEVAHIHDAKLDAIEDLVEELAGKPLLVAYEFNHDLERLRERFGKVDTKTGKKVLPFLGNGTTAAQETAWIEAWNRNELPILACHPASAGHGLNLQEGNAAHVCWFGITWDLELWDQFIRRIRRSGNVAQRIFNHMLVVRGTIDELKLDALSDKDTTQNRLLRLLNAEIQRDGAASQAGGDTPVDDRRLPMVARLSRQSDAGATQQQAQPAGGNAKVIPKGWSNRGAAQADVEQVTRGAGHEAQRERIAAQIEQSHQEGPSPQEQARSAFSGGVREQMEQVGSAKVVEQEEVTAPVKTTRTRSRAAAAEPAAPATQDNGVSAAIEYAGLMKARATVMQGVIVSDPAASAADIIEVTRELMEFIVRG